jgi:hypothetical protein
MMSNKEIQVRNRPFSLINTFFDRKVLLTIMLFALLLRIISAVYQGNNVTDLPGIFDQISYDGLARRVVEGYGFSFAEGHWPATRAGEPTAHWSYLYTLYLALIYKLFGFYPVMARVIQALIAGIFQTILVWRVGTRLFGRTVGLVAAALNAVYIYFFYYAGALITETFYITGILWTFDSAFRLVDASRSEGEGRHGATWGQWLEFGLAMGVTILLRQVFLLFLPFLYLWLWWNIRQNDIDRWKRTFHWSALRGLAAATVVLALMILPFTIRNYRAFGTFVLLNTNAGFAFYWGNHPIHGTQFVPLQPESYQDLIPSRLLVLNEGMLDRALLQEGIKIVVDDPVRFILLSFTRIEEYIKFWPSRDSSLISNISRVGSFGILLPFMLYGLWISFSRLRKPSFDGQGMYLSVIYQFIVVYASIHLLSWTLIRYRLPIDAALLLFAAKGIENLFSKNITE